MIRKNIINRILLFTVQPKTEFGSFARGVFWTLVFWWLLAYIINEHDYHLVEYTVNGVRYSSDDYALLSWITIVVTQMWIILGHVYMAVEEKFRK